MPQQSQQERDSQVEHDPLPVLSADDSEGPGPEAEITANMSEHLSDGEAPDASTQREGPGPEAEITANMSEHLSDGEAPDASTQRERDTQWRIPSRTASRAAGLYKRHSANHPMLREYAQYLKGTLQTRGWKAEVSNIARFLYYVNPRTVSLEYLRRPAKTNDFFTKLCSLPLTKATALVMLKHVRRFTSYHMNATNLSISRPQLYRACEIFMSSTTDLQKILYKGTCREIVCKRYDALMRPTKTPEECRRLLEVAKPSFLARIRGIERRRVNTADSEVTRYLQALLILQHLQRPCVVQNMTIAEWNERTEYIHRGLRYTIIGVKEHKVASKQVAAFVLSEQEESWFTIYAETIRPHFTRSCAAEQAFFVSASGQRIRCPSSNLRQYHLSYKLPLVTSRTVRRVCETWTLPHYTDAEKRLFARYLAHSNEMAEKVYREKTIEDMCQARELVVRSGEREASGVQQAEN
ncbi:uncharacterized protein ACNLHF_005260 [Anomaloglossus baeobatrachus]|uniref:uncharacterized protein LOC142277321 n=1 Tax=Anomaloglossus baeobatrachus TaxID=238106 RepID=UPI003F4F504F